MKCDQQLKKLKLALLIAGGVLLLITLPILTNQFMRFNWFKVVGDKETWISFYGSYLGGITGGLMTLGGALLTLNHQNKTNEQTEQTNETKELIKIVPKLHHLQGVLELLRDELEQFLRNEEEGKRKVVTEPHVHTIRKLMDEYKKCSVFLEELNSDNLLADTLREINELKAYLRTTYLIVDYAFHDRELEVNVTDSPDKNSFKYHALKQVKLTIDLLGNTAEEFDGRDN